MTSLMWRVTSVCLAGVLGGCGFPRPATLASDAEVPDVATDSGMVTDSAVSADGRMPVGVDSGLLIDGGDGGVASRCSSSARFGASVPLSEITLANAAEPFLSPDELTIYFSAESSNADTGLYVARRSKRTEPFGAPLLMTELFAPSMFEGHPSVTSDGLTIFFGMASQRGGFFFPGYHLYVATRRSALAQFGPASLLATVNSSDSKYFDGWPFVSADGEELWFSSERDGESLLIWRARRLADGFDAPEPVRELNAMVAGTVSIDIAPVLSADKLDVYFSSARTPTGGGLDLWTSHRDSVNDGFPAPRSLDDLNTGSNDVLGWLSPDNCRMYGSQGFGLFVAARQPAP